MPVNPHFQDTEYISQEASLVEDLIIEAVQIHGIETFYIPRESATGKIDLLYGEDILSKFTDAYQMEMYLERVDGFDGQGELLSKFGLQLNNQADLIVSIKRFHQLTDNQFTRPKEGDLVYLRYKPNLFEIKYVEDKTEFYQLGKLYFYKLRVEAFRFGNEDIQTGIETVDDVARNSSFSIVFNLGTGTGQFTLGEHIFQGTSYASATAVAEVASWNHPTKTLKVINVVGEFIANSAVQGVISSANYTLDSYDDLVDPNSPMNVNKTVQTEANTYLNFSEENPFSQNLP